MKTCVSARARLVKSAISTLAGLSLLVCGAKVQAATLTVAPSGAAYSKIQDALNASRPGDTVLIKNGTYNESIAPRPGLPNAWITIKAENKWGARIVSPDWRSAVHHFGNHFETYPEEQWDAGLRYVIFDGLDLSAPQGGGVSGWWMHHITVRNCRIHDCSNGGFGTSYSDYITLEDNVIFNNARGDWDSGISLFKARPYNQNGGYHNVIQRNQLYNNGTNPSAPRQSDGNAIIIDTCFRLASTLVANNVCYNNGGRGIAIAGSRNVDVFNNTCYKNLWTPSLFYADVMVQDVDWDNEDPNDTNVDAEGKPDFKKSPDTSANIRIRGNIVFCRDNNAAIRVAAASQNVIVDQNLLWNNATPSEGNDRIVEGTNVIKADPKFVFAPPAITNTTYATVANPAAGDFHLDVASPALGRLNPSLLVFDKDKVSRPQGNGAELGAYEYLRVPDGLYMISARNSGRVLDVDLSGAGAGKQDGARVQVWDSFSGALNQQWQVTFQGDGTYELSNKNSNKLLDVNGGASATGDGISVIQWADQNISNQRWFLVSVGEGFYKLVPQHSLKCLDVTGSANSSGVQQYTYYGNSNQQWKLTPIASTTSLSGGSS